MNLLTSGAAAAVLMGALMIVAPASALDVATGDDRDSTLKRTVPPLPKFKPPRLLEEKLKPSDYKLYRSAFAAAKLKRWKTAHRLAARAQDPLPAKVLRWLHYSQPAPGVTFETLTAFIEANPAWPRQNDMLRNAEHAITSRTPEDDVVAWFERHPPLTGAGKQRLAEIMIKKGDEESGIALLRDAWINGKFPSRQERNFLRRHRKKLNRDDHAARLDRLLWDRQRRGARRMMRRVDSGQRALAHARLALMEFAGGVDGAIARVPEALRDDPGLVYERVRWRRRKNFPIRAAELLLPPAPPIEDVGPRPKKWWAERHMLARRLLGKGHVSDAYKLVRDHGQTDRGAIAEAENLAGWIALTQLADPATALAHFKRLHGMVRFPVSIARGAYWAARAAAAMGRKDDALAWYADAARFPNTYYGHLATLAVGETTAPALPKQAHASWAESKAFEKRELVRAVMLLAQLRERDRLRPFFRALTDAATTPEEHALIAALARKSGRRDMAVASAKRAAQVGVPLIRENFPIVNLPGHVKVERALQLAIIRQESQFDPEAVSHAGARGLMQLMPATARKVAAKKRMRYTRRRLTKDPRFNVTLGTAYIAELLDIYKGSYVLAVAAYNAGTPRVRRWIRNFGDPRHAEVDAVNWVESIPFSETRNYVQRVMEGVQVYRQRMAGRTGRVRLALLEDLNR